MVKKWVDIKTYIGQMVSEALWAERIVATQAEMVCLCVMALTAKLAWNWYRASMTSEYTLTLQNVPIVLEI